MNLEYAIRIGAWIAASPFVYLFFANLKEGDEAWKKANRELSWNETFSFLWRYIGITVNGFKYFFAAFGIVLLGELLIEYWIQ